jgi:hypothetical protein
VRRALVILPLVAALLLPAPALAAIPSGRYGIGDSVMLGAKTQLQARNIKVNAVTSRQFRDAVSIVRSMAGAGTLRRKVIVHLGTNGILVQPSDCDAIARAAGRKRRVFLATVTGPTQYPSIRKTQNSRLKACASRHGNTRVLDWYGYSRGRGGWFYSDGMHLTPTGRQAYASYLHSKTS